MPDPLDLKRVRDLAECELNERVESPDAISVAVKVGLTLAVIVSLGSLTARLAFELLCDELVVAWRISLLVVLAYLGVVWVAHESNLRYVCNVFAVWVFIGLFAWTQSFLIGPVHTIRYSLLGSVVLALVCGQLMTKQFVFFATANMTQLWENSLRWREYWARVSSFQTVPGRPDVTAYRRRVLPVVVGVVCGMAVSNSSQPLMSTLVGYSVGLAGTALLFWPQGASPVVALRAVLAAIVMFLSYLPNTMSAPGVFQLPTKWLRRYEIRLALCVLTLLPLAWASTLLPPVYTAPQKTVSRSLSVGDSCLQRISLTEEENDFFNSLLQDDQEDCARVLHARRATEASLEISTRQAYSLGLLSAIIAGSVLPPAVFVLTLIATSGPLLGAYHSVFEEGVSE